MKFIFEGEDYFKVKCSEVRPFFGQTAEPNLKHRVVKYHLITNSDVNNLDIQKLNNSGKIKKTPSEFRTALS